MQWRRQLVAWHRDLGFLACGLTLVYAVSGVAVNHRADWDYNSVTRRETLAVGRPIELLDELAPARREALRATPEALLDPEVTALVAAVTARLDRPDPPRNTLWRGPDSLHLFFGPEDRDRVIYHPRSGEVELSRRRDRWLLRDLNFLHLNEGGGAWTYVADAYAVLLATLALSGVLITRGKRGLRGRGALLLALGLAVPLVALLTQRYLRG